MSLHQITHSYLRDANLLHQAMHYEQDTDPGAVGAGLWWADTVNNVFKRRNSTNTAWETYG
jgi:hypothetical protein